MNQVWGIVFSYLNFVRYDLLSQRREVFFELFNIGSDEIIFKVHFFDTVIKLIFYFCCSLHAVTEVPRMVPVLQEYLSSQQAMVHQGHILSAIPRLRDPQELLTLDRPFHRTR